MLEEMIKAGFDMEALTEEVQTLITTVQSIFYCFIHFYLLKLISLERNLSLLPYFQGYETSATTLQFVLFLLALHPKYQVEE